MVTGKAKWNLEVYSSQTDVVLCLWQCLDLSQTAAGAQTPCTHMSPATRHNMHNCHHTMITIKDISCTQ